MCGPRGLKGEPDHLFHNNGDGTFTDVSEKAGVADKNGYYGLASVFVDVNNDGKARPPRRATTQRQTISTSTKATAPSKTPATPPATPSTRTAAKPPPWESPSATTRTTACVDVYNTTFSDDYNPLYRNDGDANFTDISYQLGIAEANVPFLGWGDAFLDYDNDGWKDLIMANGHVYPQVDKMPLGNKLGAAPAAFP